MTTQIEIDPNVRLGGSLTFAGFEHVHGDGGVRLAVGDIVEVVEPESFLAGKGTISQIDVEKRLVYLLVQWSELAVVDPFELNKPADTVRSSFAVITGGLADTRADYSYVPEFLRVEVGQTRALAIG